MKLGDILVGEVWFFQNRSMHPKPKPKLNVLIGNGRYFVINTERDYHCNVEIFKKDYPAFLDHDSYVGCSNICIDSEDRIIDNDCRRGELKKETLTQLIERVSVSIKLTPYQINEIVKALKKRVDLIP